MKFRDGSEAVRLALFMWMLIHIATDIYWRYYASMPLGPPLSLPSRSTVPLAYLVPRTLGWITKNHEELCTNATNKAFR